MIKEQSVQHYDLEEQTFKFAKDIINFCKSLPKSVIDTEIIKQLVRAATSVGANYIEANGALSKKDFIMRIKICRKEAKESAYWQRLIVEINDDKYAQDGMLLHDEAIELKKIFSAILVKSE